MKSALDIVRECFESIPESCMPENPIFLVGSDLFDRLEREGYDVTGLQRSDSVWPGKSQHKKVKGSSSFGAGPLNRWGVVR
jgi:hypothetical protein